MHEIDLSRVAVVIPCHNEVTAISAVVGSFRQHLPQSRILVIDNASTDGTAAAARAAGAEVLRESRLGKGYAVLRGFRAADDADFIVMVDGDGTYSASHARQLLEAAREADLVIATRLDAPRNGAFSVAHSLGNRLFIWMVRILFGVRTTDLLSGYRVLSRRLLDSLPLIARGFEIETEITLQALIHEFPVAEISAPYVKRRGESVSKIHTYRDGYRIMLAMLAFFRDYRPLSCFGAISIMLLGFGVWAGSYPILEYARTGMVYRLPLAVLAVGLVLLAAVTLIAGLILSSVNRRALEIAARLHRERPRAR